MKAFKNILFFTMQNARYLKKKWFSLLLLFITPICMIGLFLLLILQFMMPDERQKSTLAIVDNDRTEESKILTQLLVMALNGNGHIHIERMSAREAEQAIAQQQITSYVTFPQGLTKELYAGNPIELPLVGDANKPIENAMIENLLNSMASYIESAQANILTVYEYAKETSMSTERYNQLQEEIFIDYAIYTVGKNNFLLENTVKNTATSMPSYYYAMSTLFICTTIWLTGFYMLLMKEESRSIQNRLRLFGVTIAQLFIARAIITISGMLLCLTILYSVMNQWLELALYPLDYMRLLLFVLLYSVCVVCLQGVIELVSTTAKMRMLLYIILTALVIGVSGAVLPTIYFPAGLQQLLLYTFPYEAFTWVIDIALENRNYANYTSMLASMAISIILFGLLALYRERRLR
ncbi:ABC transporter permease [Metasolibacillus meyeri]|uniref:ABC transporter permease n=1 Tax=Metasolibacillus meyeri TaxID=1071052 RepID=A0AAW9NRM9_9BACL|nr:ABC transporter permease [Metasolibacillus meyeri]MEC1178992.1 ABC transporter permease [Metasolibacillus meyeri]